MESMVAESLRTFLQQHQQILIISIILIISFMVILFIIIELFCSMLKHDSPTNDGKSSGVSSINEHDYSFFYSKNVFINSV
jgi:hypothetical protein